VTRNTRNINLKSPRKVKNLDELFTMGDPFELIFTLNGLINCQSEDDYRKLPEESRMVVALDAFHLEMENGGFEQFFFTASGNLSGDVRDYLARIGALKTCKLLDRIATMFPGGEIPEDRAVRKKIMDTLDDELVEGELFERETSEYRDGEEHILELLIAYLKPRKQEFEAYLRK